MEKGMPWLYYQNTPDKILNDTTKVKFKVSFNVNDTINTNKLDYYLAKYDMEGNYYGMEALTTQLQLCSKTLEDSKYFKQFGTTIFNDCYYDLSNLISRNNTMYFYELFLMDPSNQNTLLDVPILINNTPNSKSASGFNNDTDPTSWILVRRFYLFDNLGGLEGINSYADGVTNSTILRFPYSIDFWGTLQSMQGTQKDPLIYIPYVQIQYRSRTNSFIAQEPQALVAFHSNYKVDITYFTSVVQWMFFAANIIALIWWIVRMHIWNKTNPKELFVDQNVKLLII